MTAKTAAQMVAIMNYLTENSEGTVTDLETILGVKTSRVKRIIYEMVNNDMIEAVGEDKNRSYRLKRDAN